MRNRVKFGVVLNGPPGCGKDTIANQLEGFTKHQFKDALYAETAAYYKVDLDKFIQFASDRSLKDSKSLAGLGGLTPRKALIHVSENIKKPVHGLDYFGKVEAARLEALYGHLDGDVNIVYPDGGFVDELIPAKSFFDVLVIVRLYRNDFDFAGDSRNYIPKSESGQYITVDLHLVDGEIDEAVHQVAAICDEIRGAYLATI